MDIIAEIRMIYTNYLRKIEEIQKTNMDKVPTVANLNKYLKLNNFLINL